MKVLARQLIHIPVDSVILDGELALPEGTESVVIFAHGSRSSRHSPRNRFVADMIHASGIGTLLFDLLTREEDAAYENRFDTTLLVHRLRAVTLWLIHQHQTRGLRIGYFGASTGAAAALMAAAELGPVIGAVVSRGGRPDLANAAVEQLQSPILFIVGGLDDAVLQLNRQAYERIGTEKELIIVPGATHLFEEPGTLEEVARQATEWFRRYLQ